MKVVVDMSPIIHGSRAVKRCLTCMVHELAKHESIKLNLLYFDYKRQKEKYIRPVHRYFKETVIPIPYRLLTPLWQKFGWPHLEMFAAGSDVFYTNEFFFPPAGGAVTLATIHGLAFKIIPEKLTPDTVRALNQGFAYILKQADYLVAVSENTRLELVRHAGVDPERIYVVTHGVDKQFRYYPNREEVRQRIRDVYGIDQPYILYVGAIGEHKNVMGMLAAYDSLSKEIEHHIVLVGPVDSAWDRVKRFIVEKKLTGKVHLLGHVYETHRLTDLYNGADLFVFPSFYEGWTSPPLEAMACGAPVITSNCSSLPETVGDAAVQIDPLNIKELAYEIQKVLGDQNLRNELIQKGLKHAALHSWESAAAKLMTVFAEIKVRGPWNK